MNYLKWGHLISFIALSMSMATKRRGRKIMSAIIFVVIVPVCYGFPITYMMFTYKSEEESLLIILYSAGNRPNTIITMMLMEVFYIVTWIICVSLLLLWYFITKFKNPSVCEHD